MSTQTQTITQQVHLVNIITVAEDRLQSNFRSIINRLKHHDMQFVNHEQKVKKMQQQIYHRIDSANKHSQNQIKYLTEQLQRCFALIANLTTKSQEHQKLLKKYQNDIIITSKNIVDINSIIDQKFNQNKNQINSNQQRIQRMQANLYKAYQQILKKQDSTEVLKITKDIDVTKQKVSRNQKQYKILEHKLEKIQILNQKTQRNQSKKQIQLMKQIQQKIKKEIKNVQKSLSSNQSRNSSPIVLVNPTNQSNQVSVEATPRVSNSPQKLSRESYLNKQNRFSFRQQDEVAPLNVKNSFEKTAISKINQKLQIFQNKIKSMQNTINSYANTNKKNSKPESQQIKQKLNQIKPELIKLWAKCDTLDDRIAFNQRKMEQKTKVLNNLLDTQRQNGVGRLDQKFKSFQTQIYTTLKQLKTKVDSKVNTQQYQKFCILLEQKLKLMNEAIFLKSDKLQVKKALLFLESKIKQIILVISEDQQVQKDALLTKKQLKCISCDKDIEKMGKFASTGRGNWDALPIKQHSPEVLGKFGMTGFGSLSKKLKRLEAKDLPILRSKKNANHTLQPIVNTVNQNQVQNQQKFDK